MGTHDVWYAMTTPPWSILCFWVGWFSTGGIAAHLSGWPRMARRFGAATPQQAQEPFRFASGFIGPLHRFPVSFLNCLYVTLGDDGFRLAVFFPWRFMQPPFTVPWSAVESVRRERFLGVWHSVVRIQGEPSAIRVSGLAGQALLAAYEQRQSLQTVERLELV